MYRHHSKKQSGFTIIELSLAMTFVSILLISIALLTIYLGKQYTRGQVMKEVNQAGTEIVGDIKRSIAGAYTNDITYKAFTDGSQATAICFGNVSYIANKPSRINTPAATLAKYASGTPARFAKVPDVGSSICAASAVPAVLPAGARELLAIADGNEQSLAVYKLAFRRPASPYGFIDPMYPDRGLYIVDITIGTSQDTEILNDQQCKPPSDVQSGDEYCSINTFTVVGRVGNTYKGGQ
jgi:Tfp pilus assembly protein PilV